ncbi:MAG TPA: GspH/FimT family pseudopilin [Rhodanobacteraceae bacterium]|nr:GspH/FimT family pseudopilin [Rhodanobacteraceae bacterium]
MPRQSRQPESTARGFTLLELMFTIAVAAILMVIAIPSFTHVMASTDAAQTSNSLVSAMHLARTTAVNNGRVACVTANASGWASGWDVKLDMDGDSACGAATDTVVRSYGALDSRFHLSSATSEIAFTSTGALVGASDTSVTVCRTGDHKAQAVKITVRSSGTLSSYRDDSVTGATCS